MKKLLRQKTEDEEFPIADSEEGVPLMDDSDVSGRDDGVVEVGESVASTTLHLTGTASKQNPFRVNPANPPPRHFLKIPSLTGMTLFQILLLTHLQWMEGKASKSWTVFTLEANRFRGEKRKMPNQSPAIMDFWCSPLEVNRF